MSDLRTAAEQALKALELSRPDARHPEDDYVEEGWKEHHTAILTLRAALAAPEQEPVAWKDKTYGNLHHHDFGNSIPLYTAPPQRPAEPVQETVMYQWEQRENGRASVVGPFWGPMYLSSTQPEPEERRFCTRCGKRLHAHDIHTCTPPVGG